MTLLRRCRLPLFLLALAAGMALLILVLGEAGVPRLAFDAEAAYATIQKLSAPEYTGRLTGTAGNRKAMDEIAAQFRTLGLVPFSNTGTYEQPFEAYVPELRAVPVLEVHGPGGRIKAYAHYVDFRETYAGHSRPGDILGQGRAFKDVHSVESPAAPVFLYDNPDIEAIDELPLLHSGVQGLILKVEDGKVALRAGSIATHVFDEPAGFVKFLVKASVMEELKRFAAEGCRIRMKNSFSMRWVKTANIAGLLPAASGKLDDVEIISCHLDHLGRSLEGGYYPGALDNASGTGVMLSLARTIASHRAQLSKAFLFIAFNAEEQYLGGSWHLLKQPPLMPEQAEVLNFDMVGSAEPVGLTLESAILSAHEDPSDPVVAAPERRIEKLARRRGMDIQFNRKSFGSDHVPFAMRLIPAMTFIHFAQRDYHTTHDDLRTIDKGRLGQVGQLALDYLARTAFRNRYQGLRTSLWIVALAAGLAAVAISLALRIAARRGRFLEIVAEAHAGEEAALKAAQRKRARSRLVQLAGGLAVFLLALLHAGGLLTCGTSFGKREAVEFVAAQRGYERTLVERSRPFPSPANDSAAEFIAERFQAFGFKPYRWKPGQAAENYLLESRSMIPVQAAAPVLQLLAPDGSVLREFARGRDFLETTEGHGGGGAVSGRFQEVSTAFDADGARWPICCVRQADYHKLDDERFAQRGVKAVLIEGDLGREALAEPDYSDDKDGQVQKGTTFLRFLVSPEVMKELLRRQASGATLRAEWRVSFEWVYPKTVVGYIPGTQTGPGSELVVSTVLDTAGDGADPLPFFLALAEHLSRQGVRPKHPIVFIAFNGTHTGHLGAKAYRDSPMTFKEPKRHGWMGDSEETYGLVGDLVVQANRASSRFASGRHVVHLMPGPFGAETLLTGSESPYFVVPGGFLARDLAGLAAARGLTWRVSSQPSTHEHRFFTEKGNPALTFALPSDPGDPGIDQAAALLGLVQKDAIAPALTPLEWLYRAGQALLLGLGAALLTGWVLRFVDHRRRRRAPDPYTEFLRQSAERERLRGELP